MKHFLLGVLLAVLLAAVVTVAEPRHFIIHAPLDTKVHADCADAEFVDGKVDKVGKTQFKVFLVFACKEVKI